MYLSTYPASVRFDSGVKPHVPRQHVGPGEGPVAEVAHVRQPTAAVRRPRLVPRGHVLRQPVGDRKDLPANRADVDQISGGKRRRSGRFGNVWGQLEAVQRVAIGVAVAAQTSGPSAEIRWPGSTSAATWIVLKLNFNFVLIFRESFLITFWPNLTHPKQKLLTIPLDRPNVRYPKQNFLT